MPLLNAHQSFKIKKTLFLSAFFTSLFFTVYASAENTGQPEPEYIDEPDLEYIQEPEEISDTAKNSKPSDLNQKKYQSLQDNLSSDNLSEIIDASIKTCNIVLAKKYLRRLKTTSTSNGNAKPMEDKLKDKIVSMEQHKNNLQNLAIATHDGDIDSIKTAVRKSMKSISCPDDRNQLTTVVKKIQAALKAEAKQKQSVMNNAISQGQASQNEEIQNRKAIAQSILLLVGALNLDTGTSSISTMNGLKQADMLTDIGLKGATQLIESQYSTADLPKSSCDIKSNRDNNQNEQDYTYYVFTSSTSDDRSRVIHYRIEAIANQSGSPRGLALGPYNSFSTAKKIVESICPASGRTTH